MQYDSAQSRFVDVDFILRRYRHGQAPPPRPNQRPGQVDIYTSCTPHVHLLVRLMYTSYTPPCTPHVHLMYTSLYTSLYT
jgi:hypothetical protein